MSAESPSPSPMREVAAATPGSPLLLGAERDRFEPGELAVVCSRYDIGEIESVREFRRGSPHAPKVVITSHKGTFLLKRLAPGRDDPSRVAFSHTLQLDLGSKGFPLPRLIGTRKGNNSMLQFDGHVYELFEFAAGDPFDFSPEATSDAARVLAFYHRLLADFRTDWRPPKGTYHRVAGMETRFDAIVKAFPNALRVSGRLRDLYSQARVRVDELGCSDWPAQVIHGDWHPGNMLFRDRRVTAVLDFDGARHAPRALDLANGALQFSILATAGNPREWPVELDEGRFAAFCRGYDTVKGCLISTAEIEAIPWLMIEALIAEAVLPIAATGRFSGLDPVQVLRMVDRKSDWLALNAPRLGSLAGP